MYQKPYWSCPRVVFTFLSFSTHPISPEVVVDFSLATGSLPTSSVTTIARKLTYLSENHEQGQCLSHIQSCLEAPYSLIWSLEDTMLSE